MLFPLVAFTVGLLLMQKKKAATPPRPQSVLAQEVAHVVRETEEIAQGRRSNYSTPLTREESAPLVAEEASRVLQEAKEIGEGKRDDFSEPGSAPSSSSSAPASDDDEQAAAEAAVRKALAQQGGALPASSKPAANPKRGAKPAARGPAKPAARGPAKPSKPSAGAPRPTVDAKPVDLALAKSTAAKVAAHIAQKKYNYDRNVLKLWQGRAGVTPDGVYGKGSAAALKYFYPKAPPALYAQGQASYTPPRA